MMVAFAMPLPLILSAVQTVRPRRPATLTSVVMMRAPTGAERVTDGDGPAVDVGPFKDARLLPINVLCPGEHDGLAARR